jgi:dihydroorotate dehydrogenase
MTDDGLANRTPHRAACEVSATGSIGSAGKVMRGECYHPRAVSSALLTRRFRPTLLAMFYPLFRPLLFTLDPETAHDVALATLDAAVACGAARLVAPRVAQSPVDAMGLRFPNPIGLAAGLDKNAAHIDGLASLGFGFIECGTVTPRPQPGNPKPRLFRLPETQALINRLGFNNDGVDRFLANVARSRFGPKSGGILGLNIGRNFDTPNDRAIGDYLTCLRAVYTAASYVTVNISSPNTAGLRELQDLAALEPLLAAMKTEQAALAQKHGKYTPLVVKISPDLAAADIGRIARALQRLRIDGVIATNTTTDRSVVGALPRGGEAVLERADVDHSRNPDPRRSDPWRQPDSLLDPVDGPLARVFHPCSGR